MKVRVPVRLVLFVDGTWYTPDGLGDDLLDNVFTQRNASNIYRMHSSVQEGDVKDSKGNIICRQISKYWPGIGADTNPVERALAGIFGDGCHDLIKEVYKYVLEEAPMIEDEVWLFGFSRGAYIVRAVAGLLQHIRAIDISKHDFEATYKEGLQIHRDIKWGNGFRHPGITNNFLRKTKLSPKIKFIGAFDTVKAFNDDFIYDISLVHAAEHFRHALAMNEQRTAFKPEIWTLSKVDAKGYKIDPPKSFLQGWFLGTHADIGGANKHDGLALYPLQWMLCEACDVGLVLGSDWTQNLDDIIQNMADVLFPRGIQNANGDIGARPAQEALCLANGTEIKMWDIRAMHHQKRYRIRLNTEIGIRYLYTLIPRKLFDDGKLLGYQNHEAMGTFIHPSVYLLIDCYPEVYVNRKSWGFTRDLMMFRNKVIVDEAAIFWEHGKDETPVQLDAVRVLVCGNNGIGKSTLINKVFGSEITMAQEGTHGAHNIEIPLSSELKPNLLIHDSCGFQTGSSADDFEKVSNFLRARSTEPNINKRLHAIWYCVYIDKPRYIEDSDRAFFKIMAESRSDVPIVLVITKKDDFEDKLESRIRRDLKLRKTPKDEIEDRLREEIDAQMKIRKTALLKAFNEVPNAHFIGPVYISKYDDISIQELERETWQSLDNTKVREMFVAAQVCNVDSKVEAAINEGMRLFKHGTRTSAVPISFASVAAQGSVGYFICSRVTDAFGYTGINRDICFQAIEDSWAHNKASNVVQFVGGVGTAMLFAAGPYAWLINVAVTAAAVPKTARALLMCVADVILVMERAFWYEPGSITDESIRRATVEYGAISAKVHNDVKDIIKMYSIVKSFQTMQIKADLGAIIEKYRHQPEKKEDFGDD